MSLTRFLYWCWWWILFFSFNSLLFAILLLLSFFLFFLLYQLFAWFLNTLMSYWRWHWCCPKISKNVLSSFSIWWVFTEKIKHFVPNIIRNPIRILRVSVSEKFRKRQFFIKQFALPYGMTIIFNIINE